MFKIFNLTSKLIISLILLLITNQVSASVFYPKDYEESRNEFRKVSKTLLLTYPKLIHSHFTVVSKIDSDLTTDYIYIPAKVETKKLLIISSGVHGRNIHLFCHSTIISQ